MKATKVDLVFVIDASESMRPCFEGLARNLEQVMRPLQGFNFKLRLGFVALSMGRGENGMRVVSVTTLAGNEEPIYRSDAALFTDDGARLATALRGIQMAGDEHQLLALDCALDFPFGPAAGTRRVVAMFSDEKLEDGMLLAQDAERMPQLIQKIMDRNVLLFAALPFSPLLEQLGSVNGAQIEIVEGGDGLASVDFNKLLAQMAKSISISTLQGEEKPYEKALWGQDKWTAVEGNFSGLS